MFVVVGAADGRFLGLYGLGTWQAFEALGRVQRRRASGVDAGRVAGATLLGLAMFATLFLGTSSPSSSRSARSAATPSAGCCSRCWCARCAARTLLLGRWLARRRGRVRGLRDRRLRSRAIVITGAFGGWWPDRTVVPALALALGVAILAALSLAGSVVLASTANGIAVFMLFGAG